MVDSGCSPLADKSKKVSGEQVPELEYSEEELESLLDKKQFLEAQYSEQVQSAENTKWQLYEVNKKTEEIKKDAY